MARAVPPVWGACGIPGVVGPAVPLQTDEAALQRAARPVQDEGWPATTPGSEVDIGGYEMLSLYLFNIASRTAWGNDLQQQGLWWGRLCMHNLGLFLPVLGRCGPGWQALRVWWRFVMVNHGGMGFVAAFRVGLEAPIS